MPKRPRVFHLITRLLKGGAEAKVIETVKGLDEYRFTVGYGAAFDQEQVDRLHASGADTQRFRLLRHYDPVTAIPAVFSVAAYLLRREFDIVHTHSTEAGIIGRFAAAIADVPAVVHTVHGVPFSDDRNPVLNRFVLGCERLAALRTDTMVTNADVIAREYCERGIGQPELYRTVYSAIDVDRFQHAIPASDIDGAGVRVLIVGRLADGKGFEDLIEAIDRIDAAAVTVYLVGEGPRREHIEALVDDYGLGNTVQLLGYRDDVPQIMAACDLFVLPSYREGTPRVITEAMASGLAIIATNIAGIPEQVEDGVNGLLIEPGDVAGLTRAIERLCDAPAERERFGAAGQRRAESFRRDEMIADLRAVYESVLDER